MLCVHHKVQDNGAPSHHLVLQMLEGHELQMWAGKIPARFLGLPKPCWTQLLFLIQRCLFIPKNGSCSQNLITRSVKIAASSCWVCRALQKQKMKPPQISYLKGKPSPTPKFLCKSPQFGTKAAWINKEVEGGGWRKKNRSFVLKWKHKMWNFKIRWLGLWFLSFKWIDLLLNCCSGAKKLLTLSAQSSLRFCFHSPPDEAAIKWEGRSEKKE